MCLLRMRDKFWSLQWHEEPQVTNCTTGFLFCDGKVKYSNQLSRALTVCEQAFFLGQAASPLARETSKRACSQARVLETVLR